MGRRSLRDQKASTVSLPEALQEWILSSKRNVQMQERMEWKVLQHEKQAQKKHFKVAEKIKGIQFIERNFVIIE